MNRDLFQWERPLSSSATIKTKHLSVSISERKRSMEEKDNIQT